MSLVIIPWLVNVFAVGRGFYNRNTLAFVVVISFYSVKNIMCIISTQRVKLSNHS